MKIIVLAACALASTAVASQEQQQHLRKRAPDQVNRQAQSISQFTVNFFGKDSFSCVQGASSTRAASSTSVPVGQDISLQRAPYNTVCVLQQSGPYGRTLARSFNGSDWQVRVPLEQGGDYVDIQSCELDGCAVNIPALTGDDHVYQLVGYQGGIDTTLRDPRSRRNEISRFLIQATFGPTVKAIDEFPDTFEEWIHQQIALPVQGHRAFYRGGGGWSSGRQTPEQVCLQGSRWSPLTFVLHDNRKQLFQERVGDYVALIVDGVTRTYVPSSHSNTLPPSSANGYYICGFWGGNAQITLFDNAECNGGKQDRVTFDNPETNFPVGQPQPPRDSIVTFSNSCDFYHNRMVVSEFTVFMGGDDCQCALPANPNDRSFLAKIDGNYYTYQEMRSYVHNTLEEPDPQGCTTAPRSPTNFPYCKVVPGHCEFTARQNKNDKATYTHVPSDQFSLSCGSPGEIAAKPEMGAVFQVAGPHTFDECKGCTRFLALPKAIWSWHAIRADDQLRQRLAFALSEVIVADVSSEKQSEANLKFYDIFVRNALGNYFDILKEVSYTAIMANYLTYYGSIPHSISGVLPDENYAREIMQLFTVGPLMLHSNYSVITDLDGEPIRAYDEDDVRTMARLWTGFVGPSRRPSENLGDSGSDDMRMDPSRHDQFPKRNIIGGYLGDGYPLCYEFPAQDFLKAGAAYEFYSGNEDLMRFELEEGSPLYEVLCNRDASGLCNFQARTEIPANLGCDGLCELQTLDLVKVGTVTYRYAGRPCVTFPFFEAGEETNDGYCLDPSLKSSCCGSQMRPIAWNGNACSPQAIVTPEGKVAIVHDVSNPVENDVSLINTNMDSANLFRVVWAPGSEGLLPKPGNCGPCEEHQDKGICVCSVEEVREPVFRSLPSRSELLENLHIGSVAPDSFSSGEYVLHLTQDGVSVFRKSSGVPFDTDTIFAIDNIVGDPETRYLRNVVSYVAVQGAPNLKFRNPPMFNDIRRGGNKDGAQNEVDAHLRHLLFHPNTAPFMSYRIIQRFVTSNPSGGYVERVSQAFASGRYGTFGTGKAGDLAATIAAVLLDEEARSTSLDGDPTFGQLREPLIKVAHLVRSMETSFDDSLFPKFPEELNWKISQNVYEPPSVFSFFEPDFTRGGSNLEVQGLVAPESRIFGYAQIFRFMDLGIFPANQVKEHHKTLFDNGYTLDDLPEVYDLMNTLLTGGRVQQDRIELFRQLSVTVDPIATTFREKYFRVLSAFVLSPEFQMTNINYHIPNQGPMPTPPPLVSSRSGSDFKAIVFVDLMGGSDTFQMLVPHSECEGEDLFQQWFDYRKTVALEKDYFNVIDVPAGQQKCAKFGINKGLPKVHQMYLDKDLTWIANVGNLVGAPEFPPPGAVSNHIMGQRYCQKGWSTPRNDTGVLGRLADVLGDQGYLTRKFSLSGWGPTLAGDQSRSLATCLVRESGMETLNTYHKEIVANVTEAGSSAWSQYYRSQLDLGLEQFDLINGHFKDATLGPQYPQGEYSGAVADQLGIAAKLIAKHKELGMDRAVFTAEMKGWDNHRGLNARFEANLPTLDRGISAFVTEMKRIGEFDNVAVMIRSEFGRTPRGNANSGTDHGWNGNYFVVGGSVKGGQVLGDYPKMGPRQPSHSWESIYRALFEWFGVQPHQWDEVLPNHANFDNLYTMEDLMEA